PRAPPAWTPSGANELAGATTAMRSPGRNARGFNMRLGEPRHLGRHCLVLLAPENGTERGARLRLRARRGEETLLDAAMARQRVLDALHRNAPVLDRVHQ